MRDKSTYIEEASYQIIDEKQGLGDGTLSSIVQENAGSIVKGFAKLIETRAGDKKGKLFTIAVTASGYASDPDGLSQAYDRNPEVIDGYFKYIDLQKLAENFDGDMQEVVSNTTEDFMQNKMPLVLLGFGIGVGLSLFTVSKARGKK